MGKLHWLLRPPGLRGLELSPVLFVVVVLILQTVGCCEREPDQQFMSPAKKSAYRAERLKSEISKFQFIVGFTSAERYSVYTVTFQVHEPDTESRRSPTDVLKRITKDQARSAVDWLMAEGILASAMDGICKLPDGSVECADIAPPCGPAVILSFGGPRYMDLRDALGQDISAIDRVERLAAVFSGEPKKALDDFVAQIRKWWPDEQAKRDALIADYVSKLKNADSSVRREAVSKLGHIGPPAATAFSAILEMLKDDDILVRHSAAITLPQLGATAQEAVPALARILEDEGADGNLRADVTYALGRIGSPVESVLPVLISALTDSNANVRYHAAGGLGGMRDKAQPAIPALSQALHDEDENVRQAAVTALKLVKANDQ